MKNSLSQPIQEAFHPGEQLLQERLGVRARMNELGPKVIRDHMPEQHRELFEKLPILMIGALDKESRPWTTLLTGQPGFVQAPDSFHLEVKANPVPFDPVLNQLKTGSNIGLLGIELETRRRNRMNAEITQFKNGKLKLKVKQSFGNCPRYIHKRQHVWQKQEMQKTTTKQFDRFDDEIAGILQDADSFFISSLFDDGTDHFNRGVDVSHRGGLPGFIQVDDDRTLTFPDYSGNRFFNTLGNITLNPLTGLLFIHYPTADLLHLTGRAEILWDDADIQAFPDAERLVRFTLDQAQLVSHALPLTWDFLEYSPQLLKSQHR